MRGNLKTDNDTKHLENAFTPNLYKLTGVGGGAEGDTPPYMFKKITCTKHSLNIT